MADTPETTAANLASFGTLIANAIADGIAKNTPKKVSFGDYARRNIRPVLKRDTYHCGVRCAVSQLSNAEIHLLNKIDRSGRYINRLVEVIVRNEGSDETVEIRDTSKSIDQRSELRKYVRDFEDLVRQIVKAQENEDAVQSPAERRPAFGQNKRYLDAKAAADAKEAAKAQSIDEP